jgi:hypothetical protein
VAESSKLEGKIVAGQILVPLRRSDRVELFLPYFEQIARPGSKVVFLVELGRSGFKELAGQLLAFHTGIRSAYLLERVCKEDVENRRRSAEQQVNSACRSLRERGVKFEVHGYVGPLQTIVHQYLEKENVQLVMMRPTTNWLADSLRKIASVFRFLNPPTAPPVLLLHPSDMGER